MEFPWISFIILTLIIAGGIIFLFRVMIFSSTEGAVKRLKEDIEKTRENYNKRFGQTAAASFDYLHYEMVRNLAGNDPTALGAQYPGPSQGG